jgi:site-specific DNA-methyltransferase (adenine-specific)
MASCISGDARDEQSYTRALGGRAAHALVTDPPYCLLTRRRKEGDPRDPKGRKIEGEPVLRFESVRDYRQFTESWLPKAVARLERGAPVILWTNFLGKEPLLAVARAQGYLHLQGEYAWAKLPGQRRGPGVLRSNEELLRIYEVALVLLRGPPPPRPPDAPPEVWAAVAGYDDDGEAARWGSHPNHKPFGILEPLLRAWTRPGQVVLDPFAGSGSIPAAAQRLGRDPACIELRPEWAQRVTARLGGGRT